MSRLWLGLLAGLGLRRALSGLDAAAHLQDKRAALLGVFLNRLVSSAVGAPQLDALRLPPWVIGLAAGLLLSAADAVITKALPAHPRSRRSGRSRVRLAGGRFGT
jgi:hypothetical protein